MKIITTSAPGSFTTVNADKHPSTTNETTSRRNAQQRGRVQRDTARPPTDRHRHHASMSRTVSGHGPSQKKKQNTRRCSYHPSFTYCDNTRSQNGATRTKPKNNYRRPYLTEHEAPSSTILRMKSGIVSHIRRRTSNETTQTVSSAYLDRIPRRRARSFRLGSRRFVVYHHATSHSGGIWRWSDRSSLTFLSNAHKVTRSTNLTREAIGLAYDVNSPIYGPHVLVFTDRIDH